MHNNGKMRECKCGQSGCLACHFGIPSHWKLLPGEGEPPESSTQESLPEPYANQSPLKKVVPSFDRASKN